MEKKYIITGLDCPNCAAKLETKMNKVEGVEEVILTFATEQLRIKAENPDEMVPVLQEVADNFEPGIKIIPIETKDPAAEKEEAKEIEDEEALEQKRAIIKLIIGILVYAWALISEKVFHFPFEAYVQAYVVAYIILGGEVIVNAVKNIGHGQIFDENFLMGIATIGAFAIGEYPEAVGVMLFDNIGELFEDIAVSKSRKQITEAVDMRPEVVLVVKNGAPVETKAEVVKVGDIIQVRPGDRIPLDGIVIKGASRVDTSPITGEPVPVNAKPGSELLSGCVNEQGLLEIQVTKSLEQSMVTRILDSVENAAASKPHAERFITKFARVYTPFVVIVAAATAIIPSLIIGDWSKWVYTALTFLVISCPCALVLSVPLAFFAGIGAGSKQGILFKGGVALEALKNVKAIVMDKTGTITKGNFKVQLVDIAGEMDEDDFIQLAASCEQSSTHPIAISIMERLAEIQGDCAEDEEEHEHHHHHEDGEECHCGHCHDDDDDDDDDDCCEEHEHHHHHDHDEEEHEHHHHHHHTATSNEIRNSHLKLKTAKSIEEISGHGVKATFEDGVALCGNRKLLEENGINLKAFDKLDSDEWKAGTKVLIAWNGKYLGAILIADTIKEDSKEAIKNIRSKGLYTAMLTGDAQATADLVADATGIDRVYAELLPDDKLNILGELREEKGQVMFVGDGINDAPVLAGADVGAAMGSGADAAIEAADVVFMNSSLSSIPEAVRIARKACGVSNQNVIFALTVKGLVMILGLLGIASMWLAVFADSGVAMLCVLNSVRVLSVRKKK